MSPTTVRHHVAQPVDWCEPLAVAAHLRDHDGAVALLSDGGVHGRWSYVACDPDHVRIGPLSDGMALSALRGSGLDAGTVGLIAYDAGARPATGHRKSDWPDLMLARYPAMLAFDHEAQTMTALGWGDTEAAAASAATSAVGWLSGCAGRACKTVAPPSKDVAEETPADSYRSAVADVIDRIGAGEIFQANIARAWRGSLKPDSDPFDVLLRLADRAAAYGAWWRLGDRAVVSNSPELFLTFDPASRRIETRPIKGTRPRDPDPARDTALALGLSNSGKDRAENLMIVDLMRNDLARVAEPGSVKASALFSVESLPTVHHLVSTVTATAATGIDAADILAATFPPGSITGAPKHQAMKVIADHEPPRGPWCGSLFHIGEGGQMTASVLIRTAAFAHDGRDWRWRTQAGAGIVADSDPDAELDETTVKISALREVLVGSD